MSRAAVVLLLGLFAVPAVLPPAQAQMATNYHLTASYKIGGDGFWDYISYDPSTRHLFISRGTQVQVVDPSSGTVVGTIPDTPGVHGIAIAPELNKAFTSNGRDNSVTVFDLRTLQTITKIAIPGTGPDGITYDPATKRVFTMNGRSSNVTAIDATSNTVVGTIALPGRPESPATDNGTLYVNIEDKSEISKIDEAASTVTSTWSLAPCDGPSGLAIDRDHKRLFSGCHSKVMAISDADAGKVITTVPIGQGVDANTFDPGTQLAFSSNGDGTLTVVHEDSPDVFTVVQNAATQMGARTMAIDPVTHQAYLVTAQFGPPGTPLPNGFRMPTMLPGTFTVLVMSP